MLCAVCPVLSFFIFVVVSFATVFGSDLLGPLCTKDTSATDAAASSSREYKSLPAPQQGHTVGGQAHVCVCVAQTCGNLLVPLRCVAPPSTASMGLPVYRLHPPDAA